MQAAYAVAIAVHGDKVHNAVGVDPVRFMIGRYAGRAFILHYYSPVLNLKMNALSRTI